MFHKLKLITTVLLISLSLGNVQAKTTKESNKVYHYCTAQDTPLNSLACSVYFEARSDGKRGMQLVGNVVLNRQQNEKYPSKVSKIIYQKGQFSYIKAKRMKVKDKESWNLALEVARELLSKKPEERQLTDLSKGSIFFFKKGYVPYWAKKHMKRTLTYKSHVFYKEK